MTGTEVILDILDKLLDEEVMGFGQLRNSIGVNQATLAKHLKYLQERKYIIKEGDGKYSLGEQFLKYRLRNNEILPWLPSVLDLLNKIGFTHGITSLYVDFTQNRMDCLSSYVPENGINMQYPGAARLDFLYNPWGIIFLESALNRGKISLNKLLPSCVPSSQDQRTLSPFTRKEIESQLSQLQKEGYTDDRGGIYKGIRRFAFPIVINDEIKGAIGCGLIEGSCDNAKIREIRESIIGEIKEGVYHE